LGSTASSGFLHREWTCREISKDEAKKILSKAEEDGLIHCSTNSAGNKTSICNCCGCCCQALAHVTKYGNPQAIVKSNYCASKDEATCTLYGTCVETCQVGAIKTQNDYTVINRAHCIGRVLCLCLPRRVNHHGPQIPSGGCSHLLGWQSIVAGDGEGNRQGISLRIGLETCADALAPIFFPVIRPERVDTRRTHTAGSPADARVRLSCRARVAFQPDAVHHRLRRSVPQPRRYLMMRPCRE
jgi:hypothetical protein